MKTKKIGLEVENRQLLQYAGVNVACHREVQTLKNRGPMSDTCLRQKDYFPVICQSVTHDHLSQVNVSVHANFVEAVGLPAAGTR